MKGAPAGPATRGAACILLLLAVLGAYTGFTAVQHDLAFTGAQTELGFWGQGSYQPEATTIVRTGQTIDALLASDPMHPEYLGLEANYAAWRGYWAEELAVREEYNQRARDRQYSALKSRPAHRHSWNKMVEYASRTGGGEALRQQAQARVQALQANQI